MKNHGAGYVARIRWRSRESPDWEVDTRHRQFETWQDAGCFANGLGPRAAAALILRRGALVLRLVNGETTLVLDGDVVVWHREFDAPAGEASADTAFVRVVDGVRGLSRRGLDGVFDAQRFGVDHGEDAHPLDVKIEADAARRTVRMSIEPVAREDQAQSPEALLDVLGRPGRA